MDEVVDRSESAHRASANEGRPLSHPRRWRSLLQSIRPSRRERAQRRLREGRWCRRMQGCAPIPAPPSPLCPSAGPPARCRGSHPSCGIRPRPQRGPEQPSGDCGPRIASAHSTLREGARTRPPTRCHRVADDLARARILMSTPVAMTATGGAPSPTPTAPACAAASMPAASPETTPTFADASPFPISDATSVPYRVAARVPTTATLAVPVIASGCPMQKSSSGESTSSSRTCG